MTASPPPRRSPHLRSPLLFMSSATPSPSRHAPRRMTFHRRLYGAHFAGDDGRARDLALKVRKTDGGRLWEVFLGDTRLSGSPSLGAALNRLEYEICLRTIANQPDRIVLHGATLLTRTGAVFISGQSGGKTTLT